MDIFGVTSATGTALTWTTTDPVTGVQTTTTGNASNLTVPLSDSTTGEAPVQATVTRQVWNLDPSSGAPTGANAKDAAGQMLRADFVITYSFPPGSPQAVPIPQTISVVRAAP